MLFKEYRILMPLSVEEYRIAQLYMIQKKSREDSKGAGSRVEILVNEPYKNGPGETDGQYTDKIYHVGSHLPGWIKAILPKTALRVEEEAWNAYPYTKTRFTCPFVEKFSIEIETKYFNDAGTQDNVFRLSPADLKRRKIDVMDVVLDKVPASSYKEEEDPKLFHSEKSGRGPLTEDWLDRPHQQVMCAYKLCKVEFRYWGVQNRIERFIDDVALRRTMVVAHRQAWCWQDEWWGLTMADIRRLENATQASLSGLAKDENGTVESADDSSHATAAGERRMSFGLQKDRHLSQEATPPESSVQSIYFSQEEEEIGATGGKEMDGESSSDSDRDIFYDAQEELDMVSPVDQERIMRCTSMDLVYQSADVDGAARRPSAQDGFSPSSASHQTSDDADNGRSKLQTTFSVGSLGLSPQTDVLFLIFHGGSAAAAAADNSREASPSKVVDSQAFQATINQITKTHYAFADGRIAVRLVACPPVFRSAHNLLSPLRPSEESDACQTSALPLMAVSHSDYASQVDAVIDKANGVYDDFLQSKDGQGFCGVVCVVGDCVGGLFAYNALSRRATLSDGQRSSSPSPRISRSSSGCSPVPWNNQSPPLGGRKSFLNVDSAAQQQYRAAGQSSPKSLSPGPSNLIRCFSAPTGGGGADACASAAQPLQPVQPVQPAQPVPSLSFEVSDLFLFGSPVGQIMALRKYSSTFDFIPSKPDCCRVFNLYYPIDRLAFRVEPLLDERAVKLPSHPVSQYECYPLGCGTPHFMVDVIQSNRDVFPAPDADNVPSVQVGTSSSRHRHPSDRSTYSSIVSTDLCSFDDIGGPSVWWNDRRIDYALFCPEAFQSFPSSALPYWLYSSYWESKDVASFVLRQVLQSQSAGSVSMTRDAAPFVPRRPSVRWKHKRTQVKIAALSAGHRGYDSVFLEGTPAQITGKFAYGPMDMVNLYKEMVDVYALSPGNRQWNYVGSSETSKHGRFLFRVPESTQLAPGLHEVKLLVSGDHSVADCTLAILPPGIKFEAVVFSVDGSFTASMSLSGKHPKVVPKSVELVRYWQDLGYLILYVTGRPDIQKPAVVSWLAEHGFPFGILYFCEGLSTEPQKHKAAFLRQLTEEVGLVIHAAYGAKKDVKMYQDAGIPLEQIHAIAKGRFSRRSSKKSVYHLLDEYGDHIDHLSSQSSTSPVSSLQANLLPKKSYVFPKRQSKRKDKRRRSSPVQSSLGIAYEKKRAESSV